MLENKEGQFTNVTAERINDLSNLPVINDALFSDYDHDGDLDLIVVGEWMSIVFYENIDNTFSKKDILGLTNNNGWFQTIKEADMWMLRAFIPPIFSKVEGKASGKGYITGGTEWFDFSTKFDLENVVSKKASILSKFFQQSNALYKNLKFSSFALIMP